MSDDEKGFPTMMLVVSTLLTNIVLTIINTITLPFVVFIDFFAPDRQA